MVLEAKIFLFKKSHFEREYCVRKYKNMEMIKMSIKKKYYPMYLKGTTGK